MLWMYLLYVVQETKQRSFTHLNQENTQNGNAGVMEAMGDLLFHGMLMVTTLTGSSPFRPVVDNRRIVVPMKVQFC